MNLYEIINYILNGYSQAKKEVFAQHPMGDVFRVKSKEQINHIINDSDYIVKGSVGQGNWATIPWIAIFDKNITTTAKNGVYVVYLLSEDCKSLYLTFAQGCTDLKEKYGKTKAMNIMLDNIDSLYNKLEITGFSKGPISLGKNIPELGQLYEKACICYKKYEKGNVPSNEELISDLKSVLEFYKKYSSKDKQSRNVINGNIYSWNIIDENTIEKICDKSFFLYYNTGLPKQIYWFFNIKNTYDNFQKNIKLIYEGDSYTGSVRIDAYGSAKVFWHDDLGTLLKLFQNQKSVKAKFIRKYNDTFEIQMVEGGEEEITTKDTIEQIKSYIQSKGFTYPDGLVENFYLSLKSKPFVILAGTSGTGKTRLVKLFAEAVGATKENGRYNLVAVRPDWSDSSDLFGHVDLNGKFIDGAIIDFVKRAELDKTKPYFLCLDEMNLARVEYYLSDFLSIIETRDFNGQEIVTDPILDSNYFGRDLAAAGKYGTLRIPENLYIIGTVNMDETTFPFSKKVLDRANTIEFSYVDLIPSFDSDYAQVNSLQLGNNFLKSKYLKLIECKNDNDVNSICVDLQNINKILKKANAHIGYRVRDEIVFYMLNNDNLLSENDAFDNEIMQKILPRIQGSSSSIKDMLCELFKVCAGDYEGVQTEDSISSKMLKTSQKTDCKYKKSAKKIADMVRRFEEDGFTSYWI